MVGSGTPSTTPAYLPLNASLTTRGNLPGGQGCMVPPEESRNQWSEGEPSLQALCIDLARHCAKASLGLGTIQHPEHHGATWTRLGSSPAWVP